MKFFLLTAILAAGWATGFASRVICYYSNWSRYGKPPFNIEDIDPNLCTHAVYTFYGIDTDSRIVSRDPWNDIGDQWSKGGLAKFLELKKKNPSIKLLLGVGGFNEGPGAFIQMVASQERRRVFLESTLQFLRSFRFDGIEIDWTYNGGGGTENEKIGFSQLVKEMKPVYEKSGYVLGISTSPLLSTVETSYDLATLSNYTDFIHVMTYNYHGPWEGQTAHQAPLYGKDTLNVNFTIFNYIKKFKAVPEKLNLGVFTYGNTFTLRDPGCQDYEQFSKGKGNIHPLPYRTFCIQDKNGVWIKLNSLEAGVPYAVDKKDQWVGFEDPKSLTDKVKFAKSYKLGGISVWSLDMDDFRGDCGYGKYPLLNAIKKEMLK